jgi:hypothetical protein
MVILLGGKLGCCCYCSWQGIVFVSRMSFFFLRAFEICQRFGVTKEPWDNIGDSVKRERRREKEEEEEEEEEMDVLRGSKGDPYQEFRKGEGLENLQTSLVRGGGGGEFGSAIVVTSVPHVVTVVRGGRPFVPSIFGGFTFQKSSDIQEYLFLHHHPHHIILFLIILTMSVSSSGCLLKLLLCRWREDLANNM